MKNIVSLLVLSFLSCTSSTREMEKLEKEVIAIHDDAMAKTNDIYDMKKALQGKLAIAQDSSKIFDVIKKLDTADEAMLVWMDEYHGIDNTKAPETNISYLLEQKAKIILVQKSINSAIEESQLLLAKEVNIIEAKDTLDVP